VAGPSNPQTNLRAVLAKRYDARIQITPVQIEVIAGAVASRGPGCNLLVFGTGYDSALWADLNAGGRTLFVEDTEEWATRAEAQQLEVQRYTYSTTVTGTLADPEAAQAKGALLPTFLTGVRWDVILIDGPSAWRPHQPGRALPICWTARLQDEATHVFLHDCERRIEGAFAQRLILPRGPWIVVPGVGRERQLLWSIGRSPAFAEAGQAFSEPGAGQSRSGP